MDNYKKAIEEIIQAKYDWCDDTKELLIAERDAEFIVKVIGILTKYGF